MLLKLVFFFAAHFDLTPKCSGPWKKTKPSPFLSKSPRLAFLTFLSERKNALRCRSGGLAQNIPCSAESGCARFWDPSQAYISRAVMYAGRKRRKPVQRAWVPLFRSDFTCRLNAVKQRVLNGTNWAESGRWIHKCANPPRAALLYSI